MPGRIVAHRVVLQVSAIFAMAGCTPQERPIVISLRSGPRTVTQESTAQFVERAGTSNAGLHGFAVLARTPTDEDKAMLAARGLNLLARLTRRVYGVHATPAFDLRTGNVAVLVRFLAVSMPGDRVAPALWNGQFDELERREPDGTRTNPVLNADSSLNVFVRFHADVSEAVAAAAMSQHATRQAPAGPLRWRATVTRAQLVALASVDAVRWIDAVPLAGGRDIEAAREGVHVSAVQEFNTIDGVATSGGGLGVRVGVYDEGIDKDSPDFSDVPGSSRVVITQPDVSSHGTYIAGVIAGRGANSALTDSWKQANGGNPFQWRGIAPSAELIDAPKIGTVEAAIAPLLREHANGGRMTLSNHSYWLATDGQYGPLNQLHDNLIRGDDAGDGASIPPLLHVHSAGNFGKAPSAGNQRGFFSLGSQLKNALVVGNYYLAENRIATSSSMGPTHDGRIKPDVVAPGSFVTAAGWCSEADNPLFYVYYDGPGSHPCDAKPAAEAFPRSSFYFSQTGTSTAAAVASGVVALVAERLQSGPLAKFTSVVPLPSTLRGIVVHTATDLASTEAWFTTVDGVTGSLPVQAFPGPDFVSGYGLINAEAAVDIAAVPLVREDVIDATCDVKTYNLFVDGTGSDLKVTLAWDDPASDAPEIAYNEPLLINDLDLVLIDPLGGKHYPWKLDQEARDSAYSVFPDDSQSCGFYLHTARRLKATTTPKYLGADADGVDLPGSTHDPIDAADLLPAKTGKDHLNNLEQVVAPATTGQWKIQVSGFSIDKGPQRFSLIGVHPQPVIVFEPKRFCQVWFELCEKYLIPRCVRYPAACRMRGFSFLRADSLVLPFRSTADLHIIPVTSLCFASGRSATCRPDVRGGAIPALDLSLGDAAQLAVEVVDGRSRLVTRDTGSTAVKRFHIPGTESPAFLLISNRGGLRPDRAQSFPIELRRPR
jgi:hypothetical protein